MVPYRTTPGSADPDSAGDRWRLLINQQPKIANQRLEIVRRSR
jgi:hypothetical protein